MGKMETSIVDEPLFQELIFMINEKLPADYQIMLKSEKYYRESITLISREQKLENKKKSKK